MRPRQEAAERPRVVARSVAEGGAILLRQATEDDQLILESRQRLEGGGQLEARPDGLGHPGGEVDAIGYVEEGHPQWGRRARAGGGGTRGRGRHCLQPGEGDRGAETFQYRSPRDFPGSRHGVILSARPKKGGVGRIAFFWEGEAPSELEPEWARTAPRPPRIVHGPLALPPFLERIAGDDPEHERGKPVVISRE